MSMVRKIAEVLKYPVLYNCLQRILGSYNARTRYVREFIIPQPGCKILDIGCGTGEVLEHLPETMKYVGYDANPKYIEAAKQKYGHRGEFICDIITVDNAPRFSEKFDIVLATGVLHHLDDLEAIQLINSAYAALKSGGTFITLDGVYVNGQSFISRFLVSRDRGLYVRTPEKYQELVEKIFPKVKTTLLNNLLYIPYNHIIMQSGK